MKKCSEVDCSEPLRAHGLCKRHYRKLYYQQNKERERKLAIAWNRKNSEKTKAYRKEYNRTPARRFKNILLECKRKGAEFRLTFEEWNQLAQQRCYYCEGALPETGSSLDRIEASGAYEINNVVPCCDRCNWLKGAASLKDLERIVNKLKLKLAV